MRTSAPVATMVPNAGGRKTGEHWPFLVTRPIVRHVLLVWASRRYGEAVMNSEQKRLKESLNRSAHWNRWGPYLSERAWGTVREDYSANGDVWDYLPHDQARSKAYRWNEDGIAGICDRHQYICFALALWNGRDPVLKERMFGLTGNQGNHGEDVRNTTITSTARPRIPI